MGRYILLAIFLPPLAGCSIGSQPVPPWQVGPIYHDNPAWVPVRNHELLWELVVDVVDDYFRIEREDPVRRVGSVWTEGRLETFPVDTPTVFEPWRPDSGSSYDKLENTLQSTRRWAVVRVIPGEGGFWVDVAVHRELEELEHPVHASAGAATFRNDNSLTRVVSADVDEPLHIGWIPLGRDVALEQRIIGRILARAGAVPFS